MLSGKNWAAVSQYEQCLSVGSFPADKVNGDGSAASRPIDDNDRAFDLFREGLSDGPCKDVRDATCCEGNYELDRLSGTRGRI